jgi:RND family efflux transporter MFP subunit
MCPGKVITLLSLAATLAGGAFMAGCSKCRENDGTAQPAKALYTCGMHPEVIQDHSGNCPICGMKLTPVPKQTEVENARNYKSAQPGERKIKYYKSTMTPAEIRQTPGKDSMGMDMAPVYEEEAAGAGSQGIAIDSVTVQNMGIRTATVKRGPLRRSIRTVGVIDYDETTLRDVTAKFKGWIEELYVNAMGQQVKRGDPLFEVYSPKFYSAQAEYLLAAGSGAASTPGAEDTRTRARTRLKLFDVSDEQIAELERTRQPQRTLRVLAPHDGCVIEKNVVEGQSVGAGMKICRLADLGLVWVQAEIYEQDLAYLQLGQEAAVRLPHLADREFRGRITYIYPNVDEKTHTARVRMEFHNPGGFLKPGMAAIVSVVCELEPSALLIPDMAILRSGEATTVFVALEGGKFDPRAVTLGPRAEMDEYQVLSGVSEGERIVTSGQFMLDSESQLHEAIQKMTQPPKASERPGRERAGKSSTHSVANAPPMAAPGAMKYICPIPEHVSIEYDQPGKCPLCGTTLVPVSRGTLKKIQPGGEIIYYICPMPEHGDGRSDKPGQCPKCGMVLIPVMEAPPITDSDGGMGMH